MAFLNIALEMTQMQFRFPRKKSTFEKRFCFDQLFHSGVTQYVDCLSCHKQYSMDHNQAYRRLHPVCTAATKTNMYNQVTDRCDEPLYTISKKNVYAPKSVYMYNSIIETLRKFFLRENFAEDVKAWKTRGLKKEGTFFDVYDGEVWNTFKIDENDEEPFVMQSDSNLMLSIGVDWYQNFTYSMHSTGAIYLTILNLPKNIRDTRPFVMLAGLMPGPKESKLDQINNYLAPLVEELLVLKSGVVMELPNGSTLTVKAALTLVVADLPAAAKLSAFTLYNGICACRKCERKFDALEAGSNARDYSGWDDETWQRRTKKTNLEQALAWKAAVNAAQRTELVKQNGTRWSQLHLLDYFEPVRFTVFDSMHNLYLGTCKRIMTKVWIPQGDITKLDREEMASMCEKIVLPFGYDSGSIARKIRYGDGFVHFKAAEWLVFTVCLSPLLLKGRLSNAKYQNWMVFVEALQLLHLTSITLTDVEKAHDLLRTFCKDFTSIYGKKQLYPNIHFHLHIKEGILDYGPLPSHSAFFYERCNKWLKSMNTNSKSLFERTVMNSFLKTVHYKDLVHSFPSLGLGATLDNRLKSLFVGVDIHGSQQYYIDNILKAEIEDSQSSFNIFKFIEYSENGDVDDEAVGFEKLPVSTIKFLKFNKSTTKMSENHFALLIKYYRSYFQYFDQALMLDNYTFGQQSDKIQNKIIKFHSVKLLGNKYNSNETASSRGSFIQAYYKINTDISQNQLRPAQIKYFFRHDILLEDVNNQLTVFTFTFAFVRFYKLHPLDITTFKSINSQVYQNTFEDESEFCILPISAIHSPIGIMREKFENTNIIINIPKKITE